MIQNNIFPNLKEQHWKHEVNELLCDRSNRLSKQQHLLNNVSFQTQVLLPNQMFITKLVRDEMFPQ